MEERRVQPDTFHVDRRNLKGLGDQTGRKRERDDFTFVSLEPRETAGM